MKLRYIFLLFLWISFLGCGHIFQNQSLPQAHRGQTTASPTTAFSKHTPNTNVSHSPSDHTAPNGFNNSRLEDKELESTELNAANKFDNGENPAQKNTAFTKKNQTFQILKTRRVSGVDILILRNHSGGTFTVPLDWTDLADPSPNYHLILSWDSLIQIIEIIHAINGKTQ